MLNNIQYLRGISAFLVCGFHTYGWISDVYGVNVGKCLFSKGSAGVEIFFIISGFIMVYTTKSLDYNETTFRNMFDFLKKRIIRIMPLYTLLTLLWIVIFIPNFDYNYVNIVKIIKSILFIPYDKYPILYLGWTLNYEMFFYLIFALSFCFKKYRYFALAIFFIFQLLLQNNNFDNIILKFISSPMMSYFFSGVVIGLIVDKVKVNYKLSYLVLSYVILGLYFLDFIDIKNELGKYVFLSSVVFSIILGDFNLQQRSFRPLLFLGNISFSLYLIHPFISGFISANIINHDEIADVFKIPLYLIIISITFIISYLSYEFMEKRLNNYLRRLV